MSETCKIQNCCEPPLSFLCAEHLKNPVIDSYRFREDIKIRLGHLKKKQSGHLAIPF